MTRSKYVRRDNTTPTKSAMKTRREQRRARNKAARASRKKNR